MSAQLQRLVVEYRGEELVVRTLYRRGADGPNPDTKASTREVTDLTREGLRQALASLEGRVDVVGTKRIYPTTGRSFGHNLTRSTRDTKASEGSLVEIADSKPKASRRGTWRSLRRRELDGFSQGSKGDPMQLVEPHATQRQLVTHGGACSSFFGSVRHRPPSL